MQNWREYLRGCSTDGIVAVALTVILGISIFHGTEELSMSIASGLIGYIGGRQDRHGKQE